MGFCGMDIRGETSIAAGLVLRGFIREASDISVLLLVPSNASSSQSLGLGVKCSSPLQPASPSASASASNSSSRSSLPPPRHSCNTRSISGRVSCRSGAWGTCCISRTYRMAVVPLPVGTRLLMSIKCCSGLRVPRKKSCPPIRRNVTAASGHATSIGNFMAEPPLMITAGGTAEPRTRQKVGKTTCPPREPNRRQPALSTTPWASNSIAKLSKFGAGVPLGHCCG